MVGTMTEQNFLPNFPPMSTQPSRFQWLNPIRRQTRDLTATKLLEHSRLPLAWHDQRTALGFA
jgi:hypothetical protein